MKNVYIIGHKTNVTGCVALNYEITWIIYHEQANLSWI